MKIAIIEDSELYSKAMRRVLEGAGHEVHAFHYFLPPNETLVTLIQKVRDLNPDRILVDHNLCASFTGEDVVKSLSDLDPDTFVCVGSEKHEYCTRAFCNKDLLNFSDWRKTFAEEGLLEVVEE